MQQARWLATGFVVGLAVAGGAFLLLRDDAAAEQERVCVGELQAQVERLESAVTKMSTLTDAAHASNTGASHVPTRVAAPAPQAPTPAQLQSIADANALVDLGIQSGHWSRQQQEELGAATAELDVAEQGRIMARVSKAINDGQVKFDSSH